MAPKSQAACSPERVPVSTDAGTRRTLRYTRQHRDLNPALQRMAQNMRALEDISSPAHGAALILNMIGVLDGVIKRRDQDPMIQACYIMDRMKSLHGYLDAIERWASYVSTAYPDDVPPKGAALWE